MSLGMNKITAERNQRALLELAIQPGNDVCADCKARNPRWASHNLGIFICMNCASIHRKMGTHISKVKSLTMDTWTKDQVEVMRNTGNIKSNAHHNPDETRHPPPTNMIDSERDSDLEKYIRSKYEFRSFVSRSAQVAAVLGPSRSATSKVPAAPPLRAQTAPLQNPASAPTETVASTSSAPPPVPPKAPIAVSTSPVTSSSLPQSQFRSVSQPVSVSPTTYTQQSQPSQYTPQSQSQASGMSSSNWNTLMSLQSSTTSTLPLQYTSNAQPPTSVPQPSAQMNSNPYPQTANTYSALSASPSAPFSSSMASGQMAGSFGRSMSLNTGLTFNGGMGPGMSPGAAAPQPFSSQSQAGLGFPGPFPAPSPHAFSPQPLPTGNSVGGMGTMFGQQTQPSSMAPFGTPTFQPQSSFGQQLQSQPQPQPQPSPSPMFQTMPLAQPSMQMQMQMPGPTNPFMQTQQVHTPFVTQPQYGMGAPSPFGQPQPPQQQNPFAGWQGQQNGYAGQQWSGM